MTSAPLSVLRQVFLPFSTPLNPQEPTAQQRQALDKAHAIIASVHSCDQMETVAKENPSTRPVNPGHLRADRVNPLKCSGKCCPTIALGQPSQPLVAADGITVIVVCSREQKNLAAANAPELRAQILEERAELAARQLQQSLRRQANIELRPSGA